MTETENLVLEHLRAIRTDIAPIKDDIVGIRIEMTAMRHDLASFRAMQDLHHSEIASPKHRIERIERRLDLID